MWKATHKTFTINTEVNKRRISFLKANGIRRMGLPTDNRPPNNTENTVGRDPYMSVVHFKVQFCKHCGGVL